MKLSWFDRKIYFRKIFFIMEIIMRKLFFTFLIIFTASLAFTSGGQGGTQIVAPSSYRPDPNLNAPGVLPIAKNRVPLKIGIDSQANVQDFETNWMTNQLRERANFDLTFEVYPAGQRNQQVELKIMAGGADLPDVVMGTIDIGVATKYGQAGMIIPTNIYYENVAYWSKDRVKDLEYNPLNYVTSYDGNIYGLYGLNVSVNNSYAPGRINIFEPWLEKLNIRMPQNVNEFLNVLRAFRDQDPNGNGIKDEIPLISNNTGMQSNYLFALMTPFIYTQDNFWLITNGVIDVPFNKPAWRDGIRYSKQLYDEGLLLPLSFTQDATQMTALISPDPAKVGVVNRISLSNLGANDIKRGQYLPIPPLEGPAGRQSFYRMMLPELKMIITKNCKNPEAAFRLGDLLGNEEFSIMCRWGEKGVDWLPGPEYNTYVEILPWGTLQNKYWGELTPRIFPFDEGNFPDTGNPFDILYPLGRTINEFKKYMKLDSVVAGLIYNEQEQEVMRDYHSTILSYVREYFARFVTGDLDIDRDWDAYINDFNRMGLSNVIRVTQSAYDRMFKR